MPASKPKPWKKLSSTTLLEHPRMTIVEDDVELPDGNTSKYIYQAETRDSVTIIAIRGNDVLVQQEYSYPPNETMYQFPGGGMEAGEQPETAALRELKEESGYTGSTRYLGSYYTSNRRSKNKMYVFLVTDITKIHKEGGDVEEFITSEWLPVTELRQLIKDGQIVNFSILAGMALYDAKITT